MNKLNRIKPIVAATLLALTSASFAASMDNVVKTRSDQNIDQQYGRESVYAFSAASKPHSPDQTASRDSHVVEKVKEYSANAWNKTTAFFAGLGAGAAASAAANSEPQAYGRAGGYVGGDRIAIMNSSMPNQANGTPIESDRVVRTGESQGNVADKRASSNEPSPSGEQIGTSANVERDRIHSSDTTHVEKLDTIEGTQMAPSPEPAQPAATAESASPTEPEDSTAMVAPDPAKIDQSISEPNGQPTGRM